VTSPGALLALTRPVSDALTHCELTHLERVPLDIARARAQHERYVAALRDAGCRIVALPAADDLPDSVFVEDTAVVLDEIAIITRPGAPSRRAEVAAIADELARHRPVAHMHAPATLDGGDVLRIGRTLFVGASGRTSTEGVAQLREITAPFGYRVVGVPVSNALHLKTAVTAVAPDLLLVNPQWVDAHAFGTFHRIDVSPDEPFAANALLIDGRVIYPSGFPRTAERLSATGVDLVCVDVSELAKAEGGVTCCCLIL
jgi:dimethylargininase